MGVSASVRALYLPCVRNIVSAGPGMRGSVLRSTSTPEGGKEREEGMEGGKEREGGRKKERWMKEGRKGGREGGREKEGGEGWRMD